MAAKPTAAQATDALKLYSAGERCIEIALQTGLSTNQVTYIVKKAGLAGTAPKKFPRLTDVVRQQVIEMYVSGKKQREVADAFGIGEHQVENACKAAGVSRGRFQKLSRDAHAEIARLYAAGSTSGELAIKYGVRREAIWHITNKFKVTRDIGEAMRHVLSKRTDEVWKQCAEKTRNALLGRRYDDARTQAFAKGRERKMVRFAYGEAALAKMLLERNLQPIPQKACGKYNIDIAVGTVAVEIMLVTSANTINGARYRKRSEYLLKSGWNILYILCRRWPNVAREAISETSADLVANFVQSTKSHPAALREYRVIRSTGHPVATCQLNINQVPVVMTSRHTLDIGQHADVTWEAMGDGYIPNLGFRYSSVASPGSGLNLPLDTVPKTPMCFSESDS